MSWNVVSNLAYARRRTHEVLRRVALCYREGGCAGVLRHGVRRASWFRAYRERSRLFDRQFGVDTGGPVELWHLGINSANARYAHRYEPVEPPAFHEALSRIPERFEDFTFVDLGCGKGRALLLASRYEFAGLIGVEFARQLAAIARRNCESLGIGARIICGDAAHFPFPSGKLLIYTMNPFGAEVFKAVINRFVTTATESSYWLELNAMEKYRGCFEAHSTISCFLRAPYYAIWKFLPPVLMPAQTHGG